jgi:hypothetical protein
MNWIPFLAYFLDRINPPSLKLRQGRQDFSFISWFPEETEKTKSGCVGIKYLIIF